MENKELFQRLEKLGFPLMEIDDNLQVNETIAEVVKNKDTRLWEGFPIIFANANKSGLFDFEKAKKLLKDKKDYNNFIQLILLSCALYKVMKLKFSWVNKILANDEFKNKADEYLQFLKGDSNFNFSGKILNAQKMKKIFENYLKLESVEIKKIGSMHDDLSLEYAFSQIFTTKQKEIFLKKLQSEKLTKTEREYFYRVVKKKAIALANIELQRLAQQVIR